MKLLVRFLSFLFFIPILFRLLVKKELIIFNYHEISENPSEFCIEHNLNTTPRNFEIQIKFIKKYFNVLTPTQLIDGNYNLPAAVITFDDGFKEAFVNGGQILKKHNISAIYFLNMAPIEGEQCWSGLVSYLCKYEKLLVQFLEEKYQKKDIYLYCKKSDLGEYFRLNNNLLPETSKYHGEFASHEDLIQSNANGLYLGNHLYNHQNAMNLNSEELQFEYMVNQQKLNKYKNSLDFFSYPFGQPKRCFDLKTNNFIFKLGAKKIFTAQQIFNTKGSDIFNRTPMFDYINTEVMFKSHCIIPYYVNFFFRSKSL